MDVSSAWTSADLSANESGNGVKSTAESSSALGAGALSACVFSAGGAAEAAFASASQSSSKELFEFNWSILVVNV